MFIAGQQIPRNIEPSPFLITGHHSLDHLAKTIDIPKMSVRFDCTAPKIMATSLPLLCMSRLLSHIIMVCTTMTFLSAVASLGQSDHRSPSMLSLSLLNPAAHFFTVL